MWTLDLITYWLEHYYQLRDYELNPFEEIRIFFSDVYLTGRNPRSANYEDTCDLNWEFDAALKKLGNKEKEFKRLYIDGEGENPELLKEFIKLLTEISNG